MAALATSNGRLAKAAHGQWIARPDDAWASRNCYRCVARLMEWFDSLPMARRIEACREEGLAVEMDPMEEEGLCRFTVADKVPAHRFKRCHTRAGIGVPVIGWRANDGSGQWDAIRPPEGIAAPATALLDRPSSPLRSPLPIWSTTSPRLHARYQIWLHRYPTGTPVLQNAAVLRRILKRTLREIDPRARTLPQTNSSCSAKHGRNHDPHAAQRFRLQALGSRDLRPTGDVLRPTPLLRP
jgi:hypothetical protein